MGEAAQKDTEVTGEAATSLSPYTDFYKLDLCDDESRQKFINEFLKGWDRCLAAEAPNVWQALREVNGAPEKLDPPERISYLRLLTEFVLYQGEQYGYRIFAVPMVLNWILQWEALKNGDQLYEALLDRFSKILKRARGLAQPLPPDIDLYREQLKRECGQLKVICRQRLTRKGPTATESVEVVKGSLNDARAQFLAILRNETKFFDFLQKHPSATLAFIVGRARDGNPFGVMAFVDDFLGFATNHKPSYIRQQASLARSARRKRQKLLGSAIPI